MSESLSSISSMEITRNPFDSDLEGKLNFPGFSPMFNASARTPVNKKAKEFRWSIEQISRLYPVDMDEFPNQEYSSTYEREEDEKAAQDAINEYFSQDAIVPSPWTPNRSAKHVTFSPLPPDTQYIAARDCSMESSFTSQSNSNRVGKAEAGTQTALSFPWNVNLEEILGSAFQTFMNNDLDDSKNLSGSSFIRRNLFPHDEQVERKIDVNNNLEKPKIRSILKVSKSPTLTTSSPVGKHPQQEKERPQSHDTTCPDMSPIKSEGYVTPLNKLHSSKAEDGPLQASNIMESSGIEQDLDLFPDISPIKEDPVENADETNEIQEFEKKQDDDNECESSLSRLSALDPHMNQAGMSNANDDDDGSSSGNDSNASDKPAKITMEDLATSDSSLCDDQEQDDKPPGVSMEDLQSPDDISIMRETNAGGDSEEAMETSMTNILSSTKIPDVKTRQNHQEYSKVEEQRMGRQTESLWQERPNVEERFYGRRYERSGEDLDEDMVMIQASAALRRANRFTQSIPNEAENSKSYNYSISNMNVSELPWQQPVGMSTPLTVPYTRPRAFGSSMEDEFTNRFDTGQPYGGTRNVDTCIFSQSSYHENSVYQSQSAMKRLSPVMEDVIRRKEMLKSCLREVQSTDWIPSTPTYKSPLAGKWRTPRTYPLSYADRKAIYGRPSHRIPDHIDVFSPQLYTESKRTSWPPSRPFPSRLHSTRPMSPPYWQPTCKIYSTDPEGSVSRMPLPSHYTHTHFDSGYDEWKRSINRWEKSMKIQSLNLKPSY